MLMAELWEAAEPLVEIRCDISHFDRGVFCLVHLQNVPGKVPITHGNMVSLLRGEISG